MCCTTNNADAFAESKAQALYDRYIEGVWGLQDQSDYEYLTENGFVENDEEYWFWVDIFQRGTGGELTGGELSRITNKRYSKSFTMALSRLWLDAGDKDKPVVKRAAFLLEEGFDDSYSAEAQRAMMDELLDIVFAYPNICYIVDRYSIFTSTWPILPLCRDFVGEKIGAEDPIAAARGFVAASIFVNSPFGRKVRENEELLGNLANSSFRSLWRGETMRFIRKDCGFLMTRVINNDDFKQFLMGPRAGFPRYEHWEICMPE